MFSYRPADRTFAAKRNVVFGQLASTLSALPEWRNRQNAILYLDDAGNETTKAIIREPAFDQARVARLCPFQYDRAVARDQIPYLQELGVHLFTADIRTGLSLLPQHQDIHLLNLDTMSFPLVSQEMLASILRHKRKTGDGAALTVVHTEILKTSNLKMAMIASRAKEVNSPTANAWATLRDMLVHNRSLLNQGRPGDLVAEAYHRVKDTAAKEGFSLVPFDATSVGALDGPAYDKAVFDDFCGYVYGDAAGHIKMGCYCYELIYNPQLERGISSPDRLTCGLQTVDYKDVHEAVLQQEDLLGIPTQVVTRVHDWVQAQLDKVNSPRDRDALSQCLDGEALEIIASIILVCLPRDHCLKQQRREMLVIGDERTGKTVWKFIVCLVLNSEAFLLLANHRVGLHVLVAPFVRMPVDDMVGKSTRFMSNTFLRHDGFKALPSKASLQRNLENGNVKESYVSGMSVACLQRLSEFLKSAHEQTSQQFVLLIDEGDLHFGMNYVGGQSFAKYETLLRRVITEPYVCGVVFAQATPWSLLQTDDTRVLSDGTITTLALATPADYRGLNCYVNRYPLSTEAALTTSGGQVTGFHRLISDYLSSPLPIETPLGKRSLFPLCLVMPSALVRNGETGTKPLAVALSSGCLPGVTVPVVGGNPICVLVSGEDDKFQAFVDGQPLLVDKRYRTQLQEALPHILSMFSYSRKLVVFGYNMLGRMATLQFEDAERGILGVPKYVAIKVSIRGSNYSRANESISQLIHRAAVRLVECADPSGEEYQIIGSFSPLLVDHIRSYKEMVGRLVSHLRREGNLDAAWRAWETLEPEPLVLPPPLRLNSNRRHLTDTQLARAGKRFRIGTSREGPVTTADQPAPLPPRSYQMAFERDLQNAAEYSGRLESLTEKFRVWREMELTVALGRRDRNRATWCRICYIFARDGTVKRDARVPDGLSHGQYLPLPSSFRNHVCTHKRGQGNTWRPESGGAHLRESSGTWNLAWWV